jgi:hypothetical protein
MSFWTNEADAGGIDSDAINRVPTGTCIIIRQKILYGVVYILFWDRQGRYTYYSIIG